MEDTKDTTLEEIESHSQYQGVDFNDSESIAEFLGRRLSEIDSRWNVDEGKNRGENEFGWGILPDLILEKIFVYLSLQERYFASCTCWQWYRAFHFPKTWKHFLMTDTTLTRSKYDYGERNWMHVLDHHRTQQLISHVGPRLRGLTLTPKSFFGLFAHYHFMNHISSYAERYAKNENDLNGCCFQVETFRFEFFCDITTRSEHFIYGTGGDILGCLKRCIGNLNYLRHLELIDLLLAPNDAIHLLDDACSMFYEQLQTLTLINCTKDHFYLLHPGCFINLRVLRISPQNLGEEMLDMLAATNLQELHLVHNSYIGVVIPLSDKAWLKVSHLFKVFLRTFCKVDKEITWQNSAPVISVLYDCPFTKLAESSILTVIELYSETIQEFGHFQIPKFRSSRSFVNRVDSHLLYLCRRCVNLTTLYIRDRISTSTALLIASMTPNLRYFYLRRNAWLKKCDYIFHEDLHLDYNFIQWIKLNAKSYERTAREISTIMAINWRPFTDKEFKIFCRQRIAY